MTNRNESIDSNKKGIDVSIRIDIKSIFRSSIDSNRNVYSGKIMNQFCFFSFNPEVISSVPLWSQFIDFENGNETRESTQR